VQHAIRFEDPSWLGLDDVAERASRCARRAAEQGVTSDVLSGRRLIPGNERRVDGHRDLALHSADRERNPAFDRLFRCDRHPLGDGGEPVTADDHAVRPEWQTPGNEHAVIGGLSLFVKVGSLTGQLDPRGQRQSGGVDHREPQFTRPRLAELPESKKKCQQRRGHGWLLRRLLRGRLRMMRGVRFLEQLRKGGATA